MSFFLSETIHIHFPYPYPSPHPYSLTYRYQHPHHVHIHTHTTSLFPKSKTIKKYISNLHFYFPFKSTSRLCHSCLQTRHVPSPPTTTVGRPSGVPSRSAGLGLSMAKSKLLPNVLRSCGANTTRLEAKSVHSHGSRTNHGSHSSEMSVVCSRINIEYGCGGALCHKNIDVAHVCRPF